jgi:hypothetical protein
VGAGERRCRGGGACGWCQGLNEVSLELEIGVDSKRFFPPPLPFLGLHLLRIKRSTKEDHDMDWKVKETNR